MNEVLARRFYAPDDGVVDLSVIIRNTGKVALRNVDVHIISNLPITGKTDGVRDFSRTQVSSEARLWRPYSEQGVEYYQSVEFGAKADLTEAKFIVIVVADNLQPYVGLARFYFLKKNAGSTTLMFNVQP